MSKLKFYKKWKEDQAYSPTHEWGDEPSFEVENVTIDEPSSPLSNYSLTFNGENWIIPIDEDDIVIWEIKIISTIYLNVSCTFYYMVANRTSLCTQVMS